MPLNRREMLSRSALAGAGVMLIGSVEALLSAPGAVADTGATGGVAGYGPLVPDPKGVLALPEGFTYRILTRTGVTTLESGQTTPSNHDGTGAFAAGSGGDDDDDAAVTLLVNNHEIDDPLTDAGDPVPHLDGLVYDPAAAGGCTVVEVSEDSVREWVAIAGTSTNCAGGVTPWGTWLTSGEPDDGTDSAPTAVAQPVAPKSAAPAGVVSADDPTPTSSPGTSATSPTPSPPGDDGSDDADDDGAGGDD
ncbi:hypothetical protein SNL152K_3603 [Streptomyces sp. NL15-2K]|nr:alkaline phosphatase PhoX [Kutzneria buriramensis]WKX12203.1 DUF839 domain-containing protein [Kutzneria buriramensis]GCB46305.1 hypothetical protein SNL152K_3603 [Streptomyces sp. NL15-2K]